MHPYVSFLQNDRGMTRKTRKLVGKDSAGMMKISPCLYSGFLFNKEDNPLIPLYKGGDSVFLL